MFHDQRILIKQRFRNLQHSICELQHFFLCGHCAVFIQHTGYKRLTSIETDPVIRLLLPRSQRTVESRMAADGEIHLPIIFIRYSPKYLHRPSLQPVSQFQSETKRIFFQSLRGIFQREPDFITFFGYQFKIHIPGKSMLGK